MVTAAVEAGADVIGAHCGVSLDIDDYLAIGQRIVTSPHRPVDMPVMIKPNGSEKGGALSGDTRCSQHGSSPVRILC